MEEQKTLCEDEPVTSILMGREVEVGSRVKSIPRASAFGKSPIVLQVSCSSVYNKA